MSLQIKVCHNGDHAYINWRPRDDKAIPGCLGFALHRKQGDTETLIPNYTSFDAKNQKPGTSAPSDTWPIQRFSWADYSFDRSQPVQYRVTPMVGTPDKLTPADEGLWSAWSEEISVDGNCKDNLSCYFNRGIVSAEWVTRALQQELPQNQLGAALREIISKPGDPLRNKLAGALKDTMLQLLTDAQKSGGTIYAALYELEDPELIASLKTFGKKANLVLANGAFKPERPDENVEARKDLKDIINVYDRMVTGAHFAHNKFLVLCDANYTPQKVWTGSTNWSVTGLCTQANNGLLIEDPEIAQIFKEEWELLKAAGNDYPKSLAAHNSIARSKTIGGSKVSVWFVPTQHQEDLQQARDLINGAKEGILFLMFNPGVFQKEEAKWTMLQSIVSRHQEGTTHYDPNLYIRGVVNQEIEGLTDADKAGALPEGHPTKAFDPTSKANKDSTVIAFSGTTTPGGGDAPVTRATDEVLIPIAMKKQFSHWVPQLLNQGVKIHSKVVVIDPLGDHPVIMTGSHNLGYKASTENDDNLIIIENNSALAQAYATNIIAVYQQYHANKVIDDGYDGGLHTDDKWQDGYLAEPELSDRRFWVEIIPDESDTK